MRARPLNSKWWGCEQALVMAAPALPSGAPPRNGYRPRAEPRRSTSQGRHVGFDKLSPGLEAGRNFAARAECVCETDRF